MIANRGHAMKRRRGLVALALVMALFVLVLLAGGLLRVAWLRHSELRAAERRLQSEWLAESALDRAAARLEADPDYRGETWAVPAEALGGREAGAVRIDVRDVPDHPDRRVIRARADYPADEARRARRTRELTITLAPGPKPDTTPERMGESTR